MQYKRTTVPVTGQVQFGDFKRTEPFTRSFGYERGEPIDRYYIYKFLSCYADDIKGHVVEIGDDRYTRMFGGEKIVHSDILDQQHPDSQPTIIADLTKADNVAANSFDCIIIIQTLQFIYDVQAVVNTLYRILKPGGVVLCSVPSLSPNCRNDMDRWGDYWRFTSAAITRLFSSCFTTKNICVESYGNVLVAAAFLYGMATEELTTTELDFKDKDYECLVTIRAIKDKTYNHQV